MYIILILILAYTFILQLSGYWLLAIEQKIWAQVILELIPATEQIFAHIFYTLLSILYFYLYIFTSILVFLVFLIKIIKDQRVEMTK